MRDFKVNFSVSPYLLLLIIPLFAIIFGVYFSTKKRFRRSRNRIISLILHCIVTALCVLIMSGIYFTFEYPNVENELVILVDASYSSTNYRDRVNDFVHEVLVENDNRTSVSIVTFGYDQKLIVPMGKHNVERTYQKFVSAESPDITATDISSALEYVWDPVNDVSGHGDPIIHYPETAKILLISDGLETDRNALSTVKRIIMDGVQVDTTFYPATFTDDVWIMDVNYPKRSYSVGEEVEFSLNLKSSFEGSVNVSFTDSWEDGENTLTKEGVNLALGPQEVLFPYAFSAHGHHELKFTIQSEGDCVLQNNIFYLTFDIEEHISLLVIEKYEGESERLLESLQKTMDSKYVKTKVVNVASGDIPQNIETLTEFDEVILVNIASSDLSGEFVGLLETFVKTYGGGLFTVGGFERDESGIVTEEVGGKQIPRPHAYLEEDMKGSKLQELLPVEITDYTPPVALAIVIDRSSSMDADAGTGSALDLAVSGAIDALDALSPRDQVGVLTLEDNYQIGLSMTPMTQKSRIISTIRRVASGGGGGTSYAPAIDMAGTTLCTLQNAQRKHILLLSDGQPSDLFNVYNEKMRRYYSTYGITITVISIGTKISDDLERFATGNGGHAYTLTSADISTLPDLLKKDLGLSDSISGAAVDKYTPQISKHTALVSGVNQSSLDLVTMGGFFTSVAKSFGGVEVALLAKYVPLYAEWTLGLGKVGSFMCDLEGYFSDAFLNSDAGTKILHNAVSGMVSKVLVKGSDAFSALLVEDNYRTQVSIYGFNGHEETKRKLVAFVKGPESATWDKYDLSEYSVSGNRFTFENKTAGVYEVSIANVPKNFNLSSGNIKSVSDIPASSVTGTLTCYRSFSYSKEFDAGADAFEEGRELLIAMSTRETEEGADPKEKLVYDAGSLLSYFADVHETFDPRLLFCILALCLMMLDIAVRKFKFKWPHEIIRTYRRKKEQFEKGAKYAR